MSAVYDVRCNVVFRSIPTSDRWRTTTGRCSIADHGPAKRCIAHTHTHTHTHTLLTRMDDDTNGFIYKVEI